MTRSGTVSFRGRVAALRHAAAAFSIFACVAWPATAQQEPQETPAPALTLLMFEQAGCAYCARWNAEVGDAYAITSEGRAAPLVRVDLHGDWPEPLELASDPVFTPTFILVQGGLELSRLEGYAGEEFFWVLLDRMIADAGAAPE